MYVSNLLGKGEDRNRAGRTSSNISPLKGFPLEGYELREGEGVKAIHLPNNVLQVKWKSLQKKMKIHLRQQNLLAAFV